MNANYGDSRVLLAGGGDTTYLRFHVPAVEAARVVAAHLVLTSAGQQLPAARVGVRVAPERWTADAVTGGTAPHLGAEIAHADAAANAATVDIDIDIDIDVTAAAQIRTVLLAVTSSNLAAFRSREADNDGPQLVLTLGETGCAISIELVSSCQVWLGDAPQAYSGLPITTALPTDEAAAGRPFDIVHQYNTNAMRFPSPAAIAAAAGGRILSENWKPGTDMSWAQVAAGRADDRIDAEAAYLNAHSTSRSS